MARDQSVRISIALKKNETLLFSCKLHVPFASPQSVSIGVPACGKRKFLDYLVQSSLHMLAMPATKTIAAMHVNAIMA